MRETLHFQLFWLLGSNDNAWKPSARVTELLHPFRDKRIETRVVHCFSDSDSLMRDVKGSDKKC